MLVWLEATAFTGTLQTESITEYWLRVRAGLTIALTAVDTSLLPFRPALLQMASVSFKWLLAALAEFYWLRLVSNGLFMVPKESGKSQSKCRDQLKPIENGSGQYSIVVPRWRHMDESMNIKGMCHCRFFHITIYLFSWDPFLEIFLLVWCIQWVYFIFFWELILIFDFLF